MAEITYSTSCEHEIEYWRQYWEDMEAFRKACESIRKEAE